MLLNILRKKMRKHIDSWQLPNVELHTNHRSSQRQRCQSKKCSTLSGQFDISKRSVPQRILLFVSLLIQKLGITKYIF